MSSSLRSWGRDGGGLWPRLVRREPITEICKVARGRGFVSNRKGWPGGNFGIPSEIWGLARIFVLYTYYTSYIESRQKKTYLSDDNLDLKSGVIVIWMFILASNCTFIF